MSGGIGVELLNYRNRENDFDMQGHVFVRYQMTVK